jgi:glucosamine--fructose-6-phosphate aminotransferase (isomerizing)
MHDCNEQAIDASGASPISGHPNRLRGRRRRGRRLPAATDSHHPFPYLHILSEPFLDHIMCGIVGYIGPQEALPVLLNGLKRLEYRGYDSAGVAIIDGGLTVVKKAGKVTELEALLEANAPDGTVGIGHTRWATHGEPNDINAHPHTDSRGEIALIHNGIIENYSVIKKGLEAEGYEFHTQTDTEVLVQLIRALYDKGNDLETAFRLALKVVV